MNSYISITLYEYNQNKPPIAESPKYCTREIIAWFYGKKQG